MKEQVRVKADVWGLEEDGTVHVTLGACEVFCGVTLVLPVADLHLPKKVLKRLRRDSARVEAHLAQPQYQTEREVRE